MRRYYDFNGSSEKYVVGGYTRQGYWREIASFPTKGQAEHFKRTHLFAGTGLYKENPRVRV